MKQRTFKFLAVIFLCIGILLPFSLSSVSAAKVEGYEIGAFLSVDTVIANMKSRTIYNRGISSINSDVDADLEFGRSHFDYLMVIQNADYFYFIFSELSLKVYGGNLYNAYPSGSNAVWGFEIGSGYFYNGSYLDNSSLSRISSNSTWNQGHFYFTYTLNFQNSVDGSMIADVEPNLTWGSFRPDLNAHIDIEKVQVSGIDFIQITMDDLLVDTSGNYVDIYYTDASGSNSFRFSRSDFLGSRVVDDLTVFRLNPLLISGSAFTVTGGIYYSNESGEVPSSLSVAIPFNILNYEASEPDVIYYNPSDYYTPVVYLPSGSGNLFYRNLDLTCDTDHAAIYDCDRYINMPFDVSFIMIPDIYSGNVLQSAIDSVSGFDIIFFQVQDDLFDAVYGPGSYQILFDMITSSADEVLRYLIQLHPLCSIAPAGYVEDSTSVHRYTQWVDVCYFDSFYLKQIVYSTGDTDKVLLDIETKLLSDSGLLTQSLTNQRGFFAACTEFFSKVNSPFAKLDSVLTDVIQLDFFNRVLNALEEDPLPIDFDSLDFGFDNLPQPVLVLFNFFYDSYDAASGYINEFVSSVSFLNSSSNYFLDDLSSVGGYLPSPTYPVLPGG